MKINRAKFMRDFVIKRTEIEKNIGHTQSFYLVSRVMGVKEKELSDFVIKQIEPSPGAFAKMCRWMGKEVDDYRL